MSNNYDTAYSHLEPDSPRNLVYKDSGWETVFNEPDLITRWCRLREGYPGFPYEEAAKFLGCEQVGEPEFRGKDNVLLHLRYTSKKTGQVLEFCIYRNSGFGEKFFSLAQSEGFEPHFVNEAEAVVA